MKQRFSLGEQRLGTRLILRVNPKTKQIDVQSGEGICRYYINEKRKSVENDFSAGKLFVIPRFFTKKSFSCVKQGEWDEGGGGLVISSNVLAL